MPFDRDDHIWSQLKCIGRHKRVSKGEESFLKMYSWLLSILPTEILLCVW